jgi:hypothetical protein
VLIRLSLQRVRVSPSESATIGTLVDHAGYLTDQLKSSSGKSKAHLALLSHNLEQTLTLAVAQLSVALWNRNGSAEQERANNLAIKELDAGLGRDLESAITAAISVSPENKETSLLGILQTYSSRYLLERGHGAIGP